MNEPPLIVQTDRLSAFDVVLPDPIPHKGRVLTEIANFWFARTGHIIGNQLAKDYQAKDALDERKVIDRAKGVLMKARSYDEDAAYNALRKLAMDRGVSLTKVAQQVIEMADLLL